MVPKIDINAITIGEEIGRGAFGIVRNANWNGTNVAVKEIAIKRMKVMKTLIDSELCSHSKLRHPNIVLLMAHAMEGNRLHLITELIDGDSLDDVLFSGHYLSMELPVKLSVCKKICQAVAYLHSNIPAIIHRDIKPENLLIGDNCNTVKLCDMGLCKLKTMNIIMTTMAGGSLQPGTPPYQAPEVLVDRKSGNTSTDIWSMSCTLVEVFSECPIWSYPDDEDPVQYILSKMVKKAKPDGLEMLASLPESRIPPAALAALRKGLSYEPAERPNAVDMIDCFV